jgi:hypothetical protein
VRFVTFLPGLREWENPIPGKLVPSLSADNSRSGSDPPRQTANQGAAKELRLSGFEGLRGYCIDHDLDLPKPFSSGRSNSGCLCSEKEKFFGDPKGPSSDKELSADNSIIIAALVT